MHAHGKGRLHYLSGKPMSGGRFHDSCRKGAQGMKGAVLGISAALGLVAILALSGIPARGGSLGATQLATAPVSGAQAFNKECSACHMAYPGVFLPARSWKKIMGNLTHHFGEDASLDPATTKAITDYLIANAADTKPGAPTAQILDGVSSSAVPIRITDMPFWQRIHSEVPPSDFSQPQVKTKANCLACHRG
jgi:Dihaem cytochrome c